MKPFKVTPELIESFAEQMRARDAARKAFTASETFARMVRALVESPEPKQADSEDLAYFFEREVQDLGWEGVTKEDVKQFFDVMGDARADTVVPGSYVEPDSGFFACDFQHHGLWVSILSGQGTILFVRNAAAQKAYEERQATSD